MARGEITGRKPAQTADEAKRLLGPPGADATAIEPSAKSEPKGPAKAQSTPIRGPPVPPAWYSLREFAAAHRLSMAMLYKLKKEGRSPREIALGHRRYITFESAARWRAAQKEADAA